MVNKIINFYPKRTHVTLTSYIHEDTSDPRTTILICPGGAYWMVCMDFEGEHIAKYYYEAGFNAFVLKYSIAEEGQITALEPFEEVALAIKHIRENAEWYGVAQDRIVVCGLSAGGHLAGVAGILWNIPEVKAVLGDAPEGINRPNGMILAYPVITAGKYTHKDTIVYLTGHKAPSEEDIERFSLEKHVEPSTPPIFIWHTADDKIVPIENATLLINACVKNNVPFEAHIYPKGPHGMGLADDRGGEFDDPHVATWTKLSIMWLNDVFK